MFVSGLLFLTRCYFVFDHIDDNALVELYVTLGTFLRELVRLIIIQNINSFCLERVKYSEIQMYSDISMLSKSVNI